MSFQDYQQQAELAVLAFHQGNYREAANRYLASFRACPGKWTEHRWHIFHGYTSILQETYFPASEKDLEDVTKIGRDKHEGVLYRVEAAFTSALLSYELKNREDTSDLYRGVIRIANKATRKERQRQVLTTIETPDGNAIASIGLKFVGELIDDIQRRAEQNLAQMENMATYAIDLDGNNRMPPPRRDPKLKLRSNGTLQPPATRHSQVMVGPRPTSITEEKAGHMLSVGGSKCDHCGKTASEVGMKKLLRCARCNKAFYCSPECQKHQWKAGHKTYCRQPGQFEKGDFVRLDGIVSRPEINGTLVELVDVDPNQPTARWLVTIPGGDHPPLSIATSKMEHLRPLK